MGAPAFVFHHIHPMLGVDFENCIFPPAPAVVPGIPYVTFCLLSGNFIQSNYTKKTFALTSGIWIMQKDTDCGYLAVLHIGNMANPLLVTIMAFSKSKSTFSASTVKVENSPTATAIPFTFGINTNCGTVSTPTGIVICPTTIFAGLTLADIIYGIGGILREVALDLIFNKIFPDSRAGRPAIMTDYIASRILGRVWGTRLARQLPDALLAAHRTVTDFVENAIQELVEKLVPDAPSPRSGSSSAMTPAAVYAAPAEDTFGARA